MEWTGIYIIPPFSWKLTPSANYVLLTEAKIFWALHTGWSAFGARRGPCLACPTWPLLPSPANGRSLLLRHWQSSSPNLKYRNMNLERQQVILGNREFLTRRKKKEKKRKIKIQEINGLPSQKTTTDLQLVSELTPLLMIKANFYGKFQVHFFHN